MNSTTKIVRALSTEDQRSIDKVAAHFGLTREDYIENGVDLIHKVFAFIMHYKSTHETYHAFIKWESRYGPDDTVAVTFRKDENGEFKMTEVNPAIGRITPPPDDDSGLTVREPSERTEAINKRVYDSFMLYEKHTFVTDYRTLPESVFCELADFAVCHIGG